MNTTTTPTLTAAQRATIRRLARAYTNACNTGTGRQAETAERRLNAYMTSIGK